MKRGVVMSIHKQHAFVMTADGQFLQAPIQGTPQIGEEIIFEEEYRKPRTIKPVYWYGSAAALIMVLFLPLLFIMQRDAHPVVAYVSMDINPSVELGVDENEKVRELRALNEDGELIIKGLQFEGVNVETVAASILERAKGSHYLDTPNKDIFITSVLLGDASALKLDYESILTGKVDETLRGMLTQLASEKVSANITTISIPNEVREEATANGISSGKMAVYLMAKEEGYKLEIEQLKQQSIDKLTEPIGGVKTIVDNAEDKSKEKLKELVAKEKAEKAKQKDDNKNSAVKPVTTPKSNKPVKADKPEKPTSSASAKPGETKKPVKNGAWANKPTINPGKINKPNRPNVDKQDDKDDNDEDNDDRWNDSNNDDNNDRGDDRNQNQDDNDRDNDRFNDDDNNNDDRSGRNNDRWDDKDSDRKSNDKQREKD